MKLAVRAVFVACLLSVAGCSSTAPKPTEKDNGPGWPLASRGMGLEFLGSELRSAVNEYVHSKNPKAHVQGIALLHSSGNLHLLVADVLIGLGADVDSLNKEYGLGDVRQPGQSVRLLASVFTDDEKHSYWKVEEIDDTNRHLLQMLQAKDSEE